MNEVAGSPAADAVGARIQAIYRRSFGGFALSLLPIVALPAALVLHPFLIALLFPYPVSADAEYFRDYSDEGGNFLVILLYGAGFFAIVWFCVACGFARYTRTWLVKPDAGIFWLRRFDYESGNRFRVSEAFDDLGKFGISVTTLEDVRVKVSSAQRARIRFAIFAWLMGATIILSFALVLLITYATRNDSDSELELIQNYWLVMLGLAALCFLVLSFLLEHVFVVVFLRRAAEEHKMSFSDRADLPRHSRILRVSDSLWQKVVGIGLRRLDVVVIDVSNISQHVGWELEQVRTAKPTDQTLLIHGGAITFASDMDPTSVVAIRTFIAELESRGNVLQYPRLRNGDWPDLTFRNAIIRRVHEICMALQRKSIPHA
jgi:hypothetical protein